MQGVLNFGPAWRRSIICFASILFSTKLYMCLVLDCMYDSAPEGWGGVGTSVHS